MTLSVPAVRQFTEIQEKISSERKSNLTSSYRFHQLWSEFQNVLWHLGKGLCTCLRPYQHIVGHGFGFHDQTEQWF